MRPGLQVTDRALLPVGREYRVHCFEGIFLAIVRRLQDFLEVVQPGYGGEKFITNAQASGIDGAIIPDLTVNDGEELLTLAAERDFKTVLLVAPTTEPDREADIIEHATGVVYGPIGCKNSAPRRGNCPAGASSETASAKLTSACNAIGRK